MRIPEYTLEFREGRGELFSPSHQMGAQLHAYIFDGSFIPLSTASLRYALQNPEALRYALELSYDEIPDDSSDESRIKAGDEFRRRFHQRARQRYSENKRQLAKK